MRRLTSTHFLSTGIKIDEIGLGDLRQRITIVPQDPVLLSGTLRQNLDPLVPPASTDAEMVAVLRQCGLRSMLDGMSEGVDSKIYEGGSNLSAGERQLVCMARALLRKPKVLVMDEATANVDMKTDALIQQTIRSATGLASSTVLIIAHRLHTVMDMDKILVLDAGAVAEFGSPSELLRDPRSQFTAMVDKGKNAAQLRAIAAGERDAWDNSRDNAGGELSAVEVQLAVGGDAAVAPPPPGGNQP